MSENPDEFCLGLIAKELSEDIKLWLYDGVSTLGVMASNDRSIELVDRAYAAGAKRIIGVDVDSYDGGYRNTGKMVVELPTAHAKRQAVLDWAAPLAHEQGFDAYTDVGQSYIFVMLD